MHRIWRLVHKKYQASAFSGEGARLAGGRWNTEGYPIVYTAGSLSLAILEIIVHLEFKEALMHYRAIPVDVPEVAIGSVQPLELPDDWNAAVPGLAVQLIGNRWMDDQASAVLKVPSAIVPIECNYLLNPAHPGFREMKFGDAIDLPLDPRVLEKIK